tara:strand:+ start:183 stop:347 length:165 start_codon:yes stop_codon:yes gene_type:complete
MSNFEEVCCKVLGVILFLLIVIMGLQLTGCTCSEVPPPPIEPEYIDEVDTKHLT